VRLRIVPAARPNLYIASMAYAALEWWGWVMSDVATPTLYRLAKRLARATSSLSTSDARGWLAGWQKLLPACLPGQSQKTELWHQSPSRPVTVCRQVTYAKKFVQKIYYYYLFVSLPWLQPFVQTP